MASRELLRQPLTRRNFLGLASGAVAGAYLSVLPYEIAQAPDASPATGQEQSPIVNFLGRSLDQGIDMCEKRRNSHTELLDLEQNSDLEIFLGTRLWESTKIGLINPHLLEEDEMLDWHTPFLFPVNPFQRKNDGGYLWFANDPSVTNFRKDNDGGPLLRMEDRAAWALSHRTDAVAVIEVENDEALKEFPNLITALASIGVRNFVVGNETNDPHTQWRNVAQRIHTGCVIVDNVMSDLGYSTGQYQMALPSGIYDANSDGKYSAYLWDEFRRLGRNVVNADTHHYYGPVNDFFSWIARRAANLQSSRHYLTELGNPAPDVYQIEVPDSTIAHGYIPQALAIAVASGFFEKIFYHSIYNPSADGHSLMRVEDGKLVPKDSHQAFKTVTKFLTHTDEFSIEDHETWMVIRGKRNGNDGRNYGIAVVYAKHATGAQEVPVSTIFSKAHVFNALGERLDENTTLTLCPQEEEFTAGPARLLVEAA